MSAAATRRFVASVERTCACGATFTRTATNLTMRCSSCIDASAQRAKDLAKARRERVAKAKAASPARPSLTCGCGAPMRVAAPRCGFCIAEMDEHRRMRAKEA
jgi:hypothetical protein